MNKTSKKDFELYKNECRKWIKIFGLLDWELYFEHESKTVDALAGCSFTRVGRNVTLWLSKNWGTNKVSTLDIKMTAFHEIGELLLSPLNDLAMERFVTQDQVEEATHVIIRTLENVVYPRLK